MSGVDGDKLNDIFVVEKRRRPELTITQLYHTWDTWQPVLGLAAFAFFIKLQTFANRKDHKKKGCSVVDKDTYKKLAEKTNISEKTVRNYVEDLYEYGLVDTYETKYKNYSRTIIIVYDVPIYSDTVFCELKRVRSWADRNSTGQRLGILTKLKKMQQQEDAAKIDSGELENEISQNWNKVKEGLSAKLSLEAYSTWIEELKFIKIEEGHLYLEAPNEFSREWVQEKYKNDILSSLKNIGVEVSDIIIQTQLLF